MIAATFIFLLILIVLATQFKTPGGRRVSGLAGALFILLVILELPGAVNGTGAPVYVFAGPSSLTLVEWLQGLLGEGRLEIILSVVLGALGKPAVQVLKEKLGWEDRRALGLALGVAVGLAIVQALVLGVLDVANLTPENVVASAGLVYASANVLYRWFKTGEKPQK